MYRDLAENLMQNLEQLDSDFYNGTTEIDTTEYYSELKCSLILFREGNCQSDGCGLSCNSCSNRSDGSSNGEIYKIVPVWWEYALFTEQGEQNTTFSWSEFATYLNPYTSLC